MNPKLALFAAMLLPWLTGVAAEAADTIELRTSARSRVHLASSLFSVTTIAMNEDGLYGGGSHLFLLNPHRTLAWAYAPNCQIYLIEALASGGAVALARSCSTLGIPQSARTPDNRGPILLRLSARGDILWAKQIEGSVPTATAMAISSRGFIYVVGYRARPDQRSYSNSGYRWFNMAVLKFDEGGELQWAREMLTEDGDQLVGIAVSGTGGLLVVGARGYLAELDAEGSLAWSRRVRGDEHMPFTLLGLRRRRETASFLEGARVRPGELETTPW